MDQLPDYTPNRDGPAGSVQIVDDVGEDLADMQDWSFSIDCSLSMQPERLGRLLLQACAGWLMVCVGQYFL